MALKIGPCPKCSPAPNAARKYPQKVYITIDFVQTF